MLSQKCGYDCCQNPINIGDAVIVNTTDPSHKNDDDFEFCWAGKCGIVVGPSRWLKHTLVQFGIPGEGLVEINLLSGFLKIIKQ